MNQPDICNRLRFARGYLGRNFWAETKLGSGEICAVTTTRLPRDKKLFPVTNVTASCRIIQSQHAKKIACDGFLKIPKKLMTNHRPCHPPVMHAIACNCMD